MKLSHKFDIESKGGKPVAIFKDSSGKSVSFDEDGLRAFIKREQGGGKTPTIQMEALHELQREQGIQPSARRSPTGQQLSR